MAKETEEARRQNLRMNVLAYLKRYPGGVTNAILCSPSIGGMRAPARVHELRQMGYRIVTENLGEGLFSYTLKKS